MTENHDNLPQTFQEFRNFIQKNQDRFVRHAFFRLGDREEAEDVVQEVMIRLFQEKERLRHVEKASAYAFRMIFNACLDRLRRNTRVNFEKLNGNHGGHVLDTSNREREIIAAEEFHRIHVLLDSIPEEQAEVIRLRILDELSFVEIAVIMNLPVTTIKSRFTYGIVKLRTKINFQKEVNYELH